MKHYVSAHEAAVVRMLAEHPDAPISAISGPSVEPRIWAPFEVGDVVGNRTHCRSCGQIIEGEAIKFGFAPTATGIAPGTWGRLTPAFIHRRPCATGVEEGS